MNAIQRLPKVLTYPLVAAVGALACVLMIQSADGTQPGAGSPAAPTQPETDAAVAKHLAELGAVVTDPTVILEGITEVAVFVELHGLAEKAFDLAKLDAFVRSQAHQIGLKVLSDEEFREALKTRHVPGFGLSLEAQADINDQRVDIFNVEMFVCDLVTVCRKPGMVVSAPIWSKSRYGDAPRHQLAAQMAAECDKLFEQFKTDWSAKNVKPK